jgi:hypothetical protein
MKLKPEPREIDLYVSNQKLTEKEFKELAQFIENVKQTKDVKKKKKKAA